MKLAPDKKIYIAMDNGGARYLSVIEYPDSLGISCSIKQHSFRLPVPWGAAYSLPNIPNYRLGALKGSDCDSLTSIDNGQLIIDNRIQIFPNPAKNIATLVLKGWNKKQAVASVYDEIGRMVFSSEVKNEKTEIDLTRFSNGVYTLQVSSKDFSQAVKLVKVE